MNGVSDRSSAVSSVPVVATFAGGLANTLGDEHQLEAAIFERRDFEHLEMGE